MKKLESCKFCSSTTPSNMRGYCQACYKYFVLDQKEIYPLPNKGEITYAPNGDCICPFCGKAFRKLGTHFYYSHGLSSKEAHVKAGWDIKAKATNEQYRDLMRSKLQEKCVVENLLNAGKATRYTPKHIGRPKQMVSPMTMMRLKQSSFIKNNINKQ